jgi:hypothetical protein
MKSARIRTLPVLLCFLVPAAASLRADLTYFNPYSPFSVTVHDGSSSIFDSVLGWNGARADFGGSWGSTYDATLGNTSSGLQTFSATFHAGPGTIFTGAYLSFGQWSFSVPEGGYLHFFMDWSLPGSVYTGTNNTTGIAPNGGVYWAVGPGGGHYEWRHAINQGGGGSEFMSIMDFSSQLLLDNVSSFSVSFTAYMYHGGNVFGDNTGAGLGFSNFSVMPVFTAGTPTGPAVPETGTTVLLLGAGLIGLLGAGARLNTQHTQS